MTQLFGVIIHPQSSPSLLKVLEKYLHYGDHQTFVLSRRIAHVGNFVELDTLKKDSEKDSRKTLVPCSSIVAIVDMTGDKQTPAGFLGGID